MMVFAPISVGELFDKITILRVKAKRIDGEEKINNVVKELDELQKIAPPMSSVSSDVEEMIDELYAVNANLWDIEEGKRDCERRKCFDSTFIELARQVYIQNDRRAKLRRLISSAFGSAIIEEKSYKAY
jgi:hypothetical protein